MENPHQWPEIKQFVQFVARQVEMYLNTCNLAALCIQRAWRGKTTVAISQMRLKVTKKDIFDLFYSVPAVASKKLDGTNVGKDTNGCLWGRRQQITTPSYQKCSVETLHSDVDVVAMVGALLEQVGCPVDLVSHGVLYGELMVNTGLYDYQQLDLAKKWVPFGMLLQVPVDQVASFVDQLRKHSFAANVVSEDEPSEVHTEQLATILLPLSHALSEFLHRFGFVCASFEAEGTLAAIIDRLAPWMLDWRGEGVVLTIPFMGNHILRKWKIGLEPQPNNVDSLNKLKTILSDCHECTVGFLVHIIDVLHQVAMKSEGKTPKAEKTPKAPIQRAIEEEVVTTAIESALTKYDDLDTMFDAGQEIKSISLLILKEVMDDLKPTTEGASLIQKDVARFVGKRYGMWKQDRR